MTYRQLQALFTELGYRPTDIPDGPRVYINRAHDAISLIPQARPDEIARPDLLIILRKIAIEKGIVEAPVFAALLDKVRRDSPAPTVEHDAA